MDSITAASAIFKIVQSWGPTAISSILIVVTLYLIKKIDTNSKKDEMRSSELHQYINKELGNFSAKLSTVEKELLGYINETFSSYSTKLSIVEKDYVKNDFFFRELSGWRSEINRMSDQINSQFTILIQNIIQLFNQGRS